MRATKKQSEKSRSAKLLEELAEIMADVLGNKTEFNPFAPLWLFRSTTPTEPLYGVHQPCLCIVAQGSKLVLVGKERYIYDPQHFLLASVDLPIIGQVLRASEAEPYLGLRLDLDPVMVGSVLVEMSPHLPRTASDVRAIAVSPIQPRLLETVVRLARLAEMPQDIPVIAPLVIREIIYRLLTSDQGARLQHIAMLGGQTHRVARIAERLRKDFDKPLRIEDLARELSMSVSSLHHHFKAVTSMSPIQFQRQIRLQEARRLMLSGEFDAASAGIHVGYDDPSHFSREYKRIFGRPPKQDVEQLRMKQAEQ